MRTTLASHGGERAVMPDDAGRLAHLLRWCGMALMAAARVDGCRDAAASQS